MSDEYSLDALVERVEKLRSENDRLNSDRNYYSDQAKRLKADLEDERKHLKRLEKIETQTDEYMALNQHLLYGLFALSSQALNMRRDLDWYRKNFHSKDHDYYKAVTDYKNLKSVNDKLNRELQDFRIKLAGANEKNRELRLLNNRLEKRIARLEEEKKSSSK